MRIKSGLIILHFMPMLRFPWQDLSLDHVWSRLGKKDWLTRLQWFKDYPIMIADSTNFDDEQEDDGERSLNKALEESLKRAFTVED